MESVFEVLEKRGFIAQVSDERLREYLATKKVTVYAGFDPTADSLHLGHLVPLIALAHFQRAGHRALPLIGGATGMVGDPSGRSEERNLLTPEQVEHNVECVQRQMEHFLKFSGDNPAVLVNNHDWTAEKTFIDWLRDVGKHFTVSYMLAKDSVRRRISSLLSENDITDWVQLCTKVIDETVLSHRMMKLLPRETVDAAREVVEQAAEGPKGVEWIAEIDSEIRAALVTGLNDVLRRRDFYDERAFQDVSLSDEAKELLDRDRIKMAHSALERLNRVLLEAAYPEAIAKSAVSPKGISFTEFSYMTMQAHDFLYLYDTHTCTLQGGGSDQWGNITAGIDLIRRKRGGEAYGLTFPLVTTSSGEKFGKTAGNAVWLDSERTSPYHFYQYWINVDDRDVERYLKLFTFLDLGEIEAICEKHEQAPERREGQRALAAEMTRIVHGPEQLEKVQKASQVFFGGDVSGMTDEDLLAIAADVPMTELKSSALSERIALIDLLKDTGLCSSKGDARRRIQGGGVYLNNRRMEEIDKVLTREDLCTESMLLLRLGKKVYHLVRFA